MKKCNKCDRNENNEPLYFIEDGKYVCQEHKTYPTEWTPRLVNPIEEVNGTFYVIFDRQEKAYQFPFTEKRIIIPN